MKLMILHSEIKGNTKALPFFVDLMDLVMDDNAVLEYDNFIGHEVAAEDRKRITELTTELEKYKSLLRVTQDQLKQRVTSQREGNRRPVQRIEDIV